MKIKKTFFTAIFLPARHLFFIVITGGLITNCLLPAYSFAQGEANFWYFGLNAGLDFNGGAPVAVTNGQLSTIEGSASVSNAAGSLLFYTDGIKVWNSSHVQMPNGVGLMGHISTTQSAVIIQKPGSTTIYYIFTGDAMAGANGIRYTEVDMTLNAGLGNVTANKNIPINTPSCEKITGIRHCNNKDVWVVTHDWNSDAFRTYLVTAAGVNPIPVISNAGLVVGGNTNNSYGYLKGSPDGKKLASAISGPLKRVELFDFNNSTGIVSNAIQFPQLSTSDLPYGVEFSPDGTKMYASAFVVNNIYQFNLCAGSNTAIANSGVLIGTSASASVGSLQLGPDKKIYVARFNLFGAFVPWLGAINSPNTLGAGCNFVDNGVSLAGKFSSIGLPNFVPYYFKQSPPPFTVSVNCLTGTFTAPTVNITNCSGSTNAITSVAWEFGNPASGVSNTSTVTNPTHAFTSAGTYTISLVLRYACGNDTIKQNVTVVSCGSINATVNSATLCSGATPCPTVTATGTGGIAPYTFLWSTTETTASITPCPVSTTNYTVTITDAGGLTATSTAVVTVNTAVIVTTTPTNISCNGGTGSVTATVAGGATQYTYSWSNGSTAITNSTTQQLNNLLPGNYTVTITDSKGCISTSTATIISPPPLFGQFTKGIANCVGCGCKQWILVNAAGGTRPYNYTWSDGYVNRYKNELCPGTYSVNIKDKNGCSVNVNITAP